MRSLKYVWDLLSPGERIGSLKVLAMMIVGAAFEMLGVGLVVPVLALLTKPSDHGWLADGLARLLGITDPSHLAIAAIFLLVAVYWVKNVFMAIEVWHQFAFSSEVQQKLCIRMYRLYLLQPYSFHLQRNSAILIRNMTIETSQLISAINGMMLVATESLVAIAILGLLLWFDPRGALFLVFLFVVGGGLFLSVSKKRILRWGQERQYHEGQRLKHLQQGLGGVKDAILLGREEAFVQQMQRHNVRSQWASRMQNTFQQYPRLWLECISILGLAVVVTSSVMGGGDMMALVPKLGIFAAAAFRMIPSANRLLSALQAIRFSSPSVERVHAEVTQLRVPDSPLKRREGTGGIKTVQFEHVGFSYEAAASPALVDINLQIAHGEVIGIIGSSGAGKSTLIDLMLGLLPPSSGQVAVDGADISLDPGAWRSRVGYVPQSIYLVDDTLRRNIAFGREDNEVNERTVEATIDAAQLRALVESLPQGLDTIVGERGIRLSGGQRQRIGIARALYNNPSVLVLDEATSALDTETETAVMDAVNALKGSMTIVIVAHRLSTLVACDRIYRIEAGRVVAEGAPELMLAVSQDKSNAVE